ncbi:hypothetical protein GCM10009665_67490 [Kitasatospora nipponensis]|uniref:Condensation domain-containing protein n=1 Tax=Kitasatospora nipponensis TaxID=258049 RepID=A0ABN1WWF3_9ACTN
MSSGPERQIAFSAGKSGTAPATWGQQAIWDAVRKLGPDAPRYNVTMEFPVPPGRLVARFLGAVGQLLHLHDSLHTRLLPEEDGGLTQVLDADGTLPVVVRTCPEEDIVREGRALMAELGGLPFDCARQWPLRIGLLERDGDLRYLALSFSHTAVDGWGLRRVVADLWELTDGADPATIRELRPAVQPLEEAGYQASVRGQRQDAAARRYWANKLRSGPRQLFPVRQELPATTKFPNAVLNSPALAQALEEVAEARRTSSATVLLAAVSAMACRVSGSPDSMLQVVVNNRFLPGLAHAVSTVALEGLFHLPDVGDDFADLVRRAQATLLSTYRNAYYDKRLLDAHLADLVAQEGSIADRSCVFNDRRDLMPRQPGEEVARVPLKEALAKTTLSWPIEFDPRPHTTFAMDALNVPGSLELAMTADSRLLPRPAMERFLFGIEDLVVTEALTLNGLT